MLTANTLNYARDRFSEFWKSTTLGLGNADKGLTRLLDISKGKLNPSAPGIFSKYQAGDEFVVKAYALTLLSEISKNGLSSIKSEITDLFADKDSFKCIEPTTTQASRLISSPPPREAATLRAPSKAENNKCSAATPTQWIVDSSLESKVEIIVLIESMAENMAQAINAKLNEVEEGDKSKLAPDSLDTRKSRIVKDLIKMLQNGQKDPKIPALLEALNIIQKKASDSKGSLEAEKALLKKVFIDGMNKVLYHGNDSTKDQQEVLHRALDEIKRTVSTQIEVMSASSGQQAAVENKRIFSDFIKAFTPPDPRAKKDSNFAE